MIYSSEPSDCKNCWSELSGDRRFCKIHGKTFKYRESCSEYTKKVVQPIRQGDVSSPREKPIFEQGVEQGVTSLTRKSVLKIDDKHSHAFRFVLRFADDLTNWSGRDRTLKVKGFKAVRKAGIGKVWMSDCYNFKCWFADKSITVYFPSWKRYFTDSARTGYNFAVADFLELIVKLEEVFGVSFKIDGSYRFKVGKQHHGLIHNDLAKMYNRKKELLNVYDKNGELWLLIDNSNPEGFGLNEVECVSTPNAVKDMDEVIDPFFNQLKDTRLMPNDILNMEKKNQEMFREVAGLMKNQVEESRNVRADVDKRLEWMDKNFTSHQRILEKMETRLDALGRVKESKSESKKDKARKILKKYGW